MFAEIIRSMSALEGQSTLIFRKVDLRYFEECIKIQTTLKKSDFEGEYIYVCIYLSSLTNKNLK